MKTFSKKIVKKILVGHDHFLGDEVILLQNECNLFYHKLDAKFFNVNNFFGKAFFSVETTKTVLGAHVTIF